MSKIVIILTCALLITSCAINNNVIEQESLKNRLFAFQEQKPELVKISFHRLKAFVGGGCLFVLNLNSTKIALIKNAEVLSFYVEPGEHVVEINIDKQTSYCYGTLHIKKHVNIQTDRTFYIDFSIKRGFYIVED